MQKNVNEFIKYMDESNGQLKIIEDEIQKKQLEIEHIKNLKSTVRHSMWMFKDFILKSRTGNRKIKYDDLNKIEEEVEQLKEQKNLLAEKKSSYQESFTSTLTSDMMKHSSNPKYINDLISLMPFDMRSTFINDSVDSMIRQLVQHEDISEETCLNIMSVYECNIEKEIRQMLKGDNFKDICSKLHTDIHHVSDFHGHMHLVPAYNCVNISLYRLDRELEKGAIFNEELIDRPIYDSIYHSLDNVLDDLYSFNRETYNYDEQVRRIEKGDQYSFRASQKVEISEPNDVPHEEKASSISNNRNSEIKDQNDLSLS